MSQKLILCEHMYQVFGHYEHFRPAPTETGNWGAQLLFDPIAMTLTFEVQYGECKEECRKRITVHLSEFAEKLKEIAAENIMGELQYRKLDGPAPVSRENAGKEK